MLYQNYVQIIGNLTADAELKDLPSGQKVLNFSVATNWATGEKEGVDYHNIEMFGNVEGVAPHLTTGKQVMVEARLKTDKWEDENGNPRSRVKLVAYNLDLGSSPKAEKSAE